MHQIVFTEFFAIQSLNPSFLKDPLREVSISDMRIFDPIQHSVVIASLIWVALRVVPEPDRDVAEDAWRTGFLKEYGASQTVFSDHQIFDYSEFFDIAPEFPIAPSWMYRARTVAGRLSTLLRRLPIILPKVNRTKSTSRDTAMLYAQRYPGTRLEGVTTKDLEVHYARTGEQIGGPCEMRAAWKFNDLKPRVYYAQGGKDYFHARYIKPIAVTFMEAFQMTSLEARQDPTRILNQEYYFESFITTWDLTSFTTNLSELKYFLYWITELLAGELCDIEILDYSEGVKTVPVIDLLRAYNENVNLGSEFSIHRIIDRFYLDLEDPYPRQANSGMLGFPLVSYVVIGDIPRWYVDMFAVPSPEWIRHGLVHTLE